eukprot:3108458-Prymnesium_polylepis.1
MRLACVRTSRMSSVRTRADSQSFLQSRVLMRCVWKPCVAKRNVSKLEQAQWQSGKLQAQQCALPMVH